MKKLCLFLGFALLFPALSQAAEQPLLRVGARVFTEQTLLAELTAQYLRTKNYNVQITGGLGSNLARSAGKRPVRPVVGIHRRLASGL